MADADDTGAYRPTRTSNGRLVQPWTLIAVFVGLATMEIVGDLVIQSRVPESSDWDAAAAFIDEAWQTGDTAVAAPEWSDPLLRLHLPGRLTVQDAGRSDLAPYTRLWEISSRGAQSPWAAGRVVAQTERFGQLRVRRYDLGPSPVLFDLTRHIADAEVSVPGRECAMRHTRFEGGGLFRGATWPADRFFCGPNEWLWVGQTVLEDLDMNNRYCIWQHPQAGEIPTTTTFRDVPLGDEVVVHAGLYYEHERRLENGPVTVQVLVNGAEVGRMVHRDGDGWERLVANTHPIAGAERPERGDVSIVVSAPSPDIRTLCWAASVRERSDRDDEPSSSRSFAEARP